MVDLRGWLGLGTNEDAVSKTLDYLGSFGTTASDAVGTAATALGDTVSSAASALSDAYAVPTEERRPQYSGPSYAQPSPEPSPAPPVRDDWRRPEPIAPPPERGYWQPTEQEQAAMGPPVGPEWLPSPVRQAAGVVGSAAAAARGAEPISGPWIPGFAEQAAGSLVAGAGPVGAATDYLDARANPTAPMLVRSGILVTDLSPEQQERHNELQRRTSPASRRPGEAPLSPDELTEYRAIQDALEGRYREIKDDPDAFMGYYHAAPGSDVLPAFLGVAAAPAVGGALGSAARGGASALGAGARTASGIGYAADIAAQAAFDPTTPFVQGPIDAVTAAARRGGAGLVRRGAGAVGSHLAENAGRVAAADAGMAAEGSTAAPGVFGLSGLGPDLPAVQGMRPRIVPPDVADALDFPVRVPDDPATIRAIEAAGGSVDPERGVTLNVIRYQGPEAHGGTATRGAPFYTAGPPGAPSEYATGVNTPNAVGGTERIEGRTRFRNPLIIGDAPGSAQGFNEAMAQFAKPSANEAAVAAAEQTLNQAQAALRAYRDTLPDRFGPESLRNRYVDAVSRASEDLNALRDRGPLLSNRGDVLESRDIDAAITDARYAGPEGSRARAQALKDLVSRYGGDPDVIDDLLEIRGADAPESAWAIKENILAANARKAGHDGVITVRGSLPSMAEVNQHPAVVEARAARDAATIARNGAIARGATGAERDAVDAAYASAHEAWEAAQAAAKRELASSNITELMDPREARNPTPGTPTAELKAAYKRAKDAEARFEAASGTPYVDEARAATARATRSAARRELDEANAALDALMNETDTPSGYALREDVKTPAMRAEDAAEEARATGLADRAFNHPDVRAAGQRALAADAALKQARASGDRAAIQAAEQERMAAYAAHAQLQRQVHQDLQQQASTGSTTAQASAGALPATAPTDRLAGVNRVLAQGVASTVSGGVGAQVNRELDPDDPYAGLKGFAAGALVPALAARGGGALARRAGAGTPGALATLGNVPPSRVNQGVLPGTHPLRQPTPGPVGPFPPPAATAGTPAAGAPPASFFGRFPGVRQAVAAAQQRAAGMAARGVRPLGPAEWGMKLAGQTGYSSMVGPTTFTASMLGGPIEMAWSLPKQAGKAIAPRRLGGRAAPAEALAVGQGAVQGLGRVGTEVLNAVRGRGRYAATPGHEPLSGQTVNPIGHAVATGLEVGGRFWSGVPDAIYGTIGRSVGEHKAAAQAATDAGLTGAPWRQHYEDLLADVESVKAGQLATMSATQDVIDGGTAAGKRSSYQDELGAVGKNAKDIATVALVPDGKGGRKPLPVVGNMISPFFNTPWNMELRLAEKTPGVGALMNTQRGFDKAYDQVMGTALVAGMGGYAAAGMITGSGPDDPDKKKMLTSQGWRPYSTNIGGYYIQNRLLGGEFAPLLNAVGDAHDAMVYSKDKDIPGVAGNFGARIGKQMQERVWLQGLSELLGALDAGYEGGFGAGAERYAAGLATRMVPYAATARSALVSQDPWLRTTDKGPLTTAPGRIGQQVQRGLGLGQGVPALGVAPLPIEQDVLGRPQANPQRGAAAFVARVGTERDEPVVKAFQAGGVDIGAPPTDLAVAEGRAQLSPAQQRRWNTLRGQALLAARADILGARALPAAERSAELRRILGAAAREAAAGVEPTITQQQRVLAGRRAAS